MNIIPKISIMVFALALLSLGLATAAEKPVPPQPVAQSSASSGQLKTAPVSKKAKDKKRSKRRGKAYSKATLSAFQPVPQTQSVQGAESAASIALSPVVKKNAVQRPEESPAPGSETAGFVIPDVDAAYDEETSNAQHERATGAVGESSELGQESVSVIDRFADKPKAKPIANGPLRVRMKDSGLRASVQIPLTTDK